MRLGFHGSRNVDSHLLGHLVDMYVVTNVSEELSASILKVNGGNRFLRAFVNHDDLIQKTTVQIAVKMGVF